MCNKISTASVPLQIQVTQDNKVHIITGNLQLKSNQKRRHQAALKTLEQMITHAVKVDKDGRVDLSHNTNKKTLAHKANVLQYIYFESPMRILPLSKITAWRNMSPKTAYSPARDWP